ncbi:MAG: cadherin-like beta sandwich domain-containing protein, partial [Gammaproteobacteria bacterium]|nr:cadherin-like beta sandwich domain-containing protein [Gammaproteobacteria bacterium]
MLGAPQGAAAQVDESSAELDNLRARGLGGPKNTADLALFPEFSAGVFTYKTAIASSHSGGVWVTETVKKRLRATSAEDRQGLGRSNNVNGSTDNVLPVPVTVTLVVTSIDRTVTKTYRVEVSVAPSATTPTGVAVASRPEKLRVTWDAAPDEFISNYSVRWRTAATDGPDGTPGNSDDVAAGNWQGNTATAGSPVTIGDEDDGVGVGRVLGYTITGLTDDTEYDIQVRAENINGESAWSSSQTATPGDEADATLSALAADGSDSVALVFAPVFDAETEEYTAQMGRDSTSVAFTATFAQSGASATIAFDGGTAAAITSGTAATAQNVAAGGETTAEIVVTASDGATTKTYTVIVRRDPAAPGAPTGVAASAGPRAGTATLTWSAPVNTGGVPLVDFRVRWRTAGAGGSAAGAWQNLAGEHLACNSILIEDHKDCGESVAPDQTRYTVTGLGGVAYDFAVGAVNSGGIGDWVEVEFTPTAERDPHLSALTATDSEGADAALSPAFSAEVFAYTASVPNVAGSATITATPAGDNATFTVKIGGADAVAGTSGQASAAGIIDKGATVPFVVETAAETGGATATYRVDITRQPGVAGAPQNVAANDDEVTGAANITWAPPADLGDVTVDATSISSYRIRWRTAGNDGPDGVSGNTDDVAAGAWQDANGDDAECNDTDATNDADCGEATSGGAAHVLSGLTDGTPYDISLAAVNAHGIGAWSEEVQVTTSGDADATLSGLIVVSPDGSFALTSLVKTGAQTSAGFAQKYVTYKADISAALTAVRIRPTASADGVLLTRRATRLSPAVDAATGAIDTSQLTRSSLRLFNPRQTSGVNSELFAVPLGGALEYEITVRAKNGDTRAYTLVVNRPL